MQLEPKFMQSSVCRSHHTCRADWQTPRINMSRPVCFALRIREPDSLFIAHITDAIGRMRLDENHATAHTDRDTRIITAT